ncbi:hypothetical protein [Microvirga arabica]|uniref:hypothetical protein n=1 Tax=Microvirga arabica TaxID=1128671 RepID=UPI001FE5F5C7|nr:hypothetical protein [Microvirga arabica]
MAYIVKDPSVRAPEVAGPASAVILPEIVMALQANSPGQVFVERSGGAEELVRGLAVPLAGLASSAA